MTIISIMITTTLVIQNSARNALFCKVGLKMWGFVLSLKCFNKGDWVHVVSKNLLSNLQYCSGSFGHMHSNDTIHNFIKQCMKVIAPFRMSRYERWNTHIINHFYREEIKDKLYRIINFKIYYVNIFKFSKYVEKKMVKKTFDLYSLMFIS